MTRRLETIAELRSWRQGLPAGPGFVPTLGGLHAGHQSLIRRSLDENEHTVVSLFLNPTQFDRADDLAAYPAVLADDLAVLERLGVAAVFVPSQDALYPDGFAYRVVETRLARELEGAHRPGHFEGVLSVVLKLFELVRPRRAYFGEKDWQQLELIRGMVEAFFLPVEIVPCATVRDPDGLALSSRNRRLTPTAREQAAELYRILGRAGSADEAQEALGAAGFAVDYVVDRDQRRLAAVVLDGVRLIDNIPLKARPPGGPENPE